MTNMTSMFESATSFNQPLNDWDVSNVWDMGWMFREATSFNQPLNDWDVSNVTNMYGMFQSETSLLSGASFERDGSPSASMASSGHRVKTSGGGGKQALWAGWRSSRTTRFAMRLAQWPTSADASGSTAHSSYGMRRHASSFATAHVATRPRPYEVWATATLRRPRGWLSSNAWSASRAYALAARSSTRIVWQYLESLLLIVLWNFKDAVAMRAQLL